MLPFNNRHDFDCNRFIFMCVEVTCFQVISDGSLEEREVVGEFSGNQLICSVMSSPTLRQFDSSRFYFWANGENLTKRSRCTTFAEANPLKVVIIPHFLEGFSNLMRRVFVIGFDERFMKDDELELAESRHILIIQLLMGN